MTILTLVTIFSNNYDDSNFITFSPGVTRSRESSLRTKPAKRDLEAILG